MANPEHEEIAENGENAIAAWRAKHPDTVLDLSDTILAAAELSGANLSGTNLNGAHLIQANLSRANLNGAQLASAFLLGADLSEADLRRADLRGANLSGADLRNAYVEHTIFDDIDLSGAQDLDSVRHHGPSTISVDTLFRSHGKIPDKFLRGCGVPEALIVQLPSILNSMQPIQFYSCFISYSHEDKDFARRLHDSLQGKGIRCWLDEKQLLPGDDIYEQVDRGLKLWDKVLLCASDHALQSWWVDNEIDKAPVFRCAFR